MEFASNYLEFNADDVFDYCQTREKTTLPYIRKVQPQKTSTETLLLRFFRFIQVPVGLVDPIGFILFVKNRKFLCKFAISLFGG